MAYVRGNLAVREKTSERVHGTPKYRETTKVVTRKAQLPMREKLLYIMTIAFVVMIAGTMIWRYAYIYNLKVQVHNADRATQRINSQLTEVEVEKQKLLDQVPEKAATYGFVTPQTDSIRVDDESADAASITVKK